MTRVLYNVAIGATAAGVGLAVRPETWLEMAAVAVGVMAANLLGYVEGLHSQ